MGYRKKLAKIMKKRRHSLDVVRKVLREEYEDEVKEASDVKNLLVKEGDHEISHDDIDSKLVPENAKTSDEVAPVIPEQLSNEDITLHGIATFLNKMSKRDKVLMTNMHKVAQNSVEQELHKAAVRKMAREEHTRVCNEVQFRLKNLPKDKLPSDAVKGNKDKALAYCVSNVNVLCAKCK